MRTYPYDAWILTPSFKPKAVRIEEKYKSYMSSEWELAAGGQAYSQKDLFATMEDAIEAGWERIHAQETKLAKMQDGIKKKRAALVKAAGAD